MPQLFLGERVFNPKEGLFIQNKRNNSAEKRAQSTWVESVTFFTLLFRRSRKPNTKLVFFKFSGIEPQRTRIQVLLICS